LADKARDFEESSMGANRVTLVLADGRQVPNVILAGGSEIVRVESRDIVDARELGFAADDIVDVLSDIAPRGPRIMADASRDRLASVIGWLVVAVPSLVVFLFVAAISSLKLGPSGGVFYALALAAWVALLVWRSRRA
jgi:hypothetical protein